MTRASPWCCTCWTRCTTCAVPSPTCWRKCAGRTGKGDLGGGTVIASGGKAGARQSRAACEDERLSFAVKAHSVLAAGLLRLRLGRKRLSGRLPRLLLSSPCRRGSSTPRLLLETPPIHWRAPASNRKAYVYWIPACAGMTSEGRG